MLFGKPNTYSWETRSSRRNLGRRLSVLAFIVLAMILILMILSRNQTTYVSIQAPSASTVGTETSHNLTVPVQHLKFPPDWPVAA